KVLAFVLFFFFFQAEDGIRDYKVTGVQTCALPIFVRALIPINCALIQRKQKPRSLDWLHEAAKLFTEKENVRGLMQMDLALIERSEERRVGKECRSRWWLYHEKKKAR